MPPLIGDNLGVLFCLKRGSSRNLFANEILKYLAYLWLNLPFFLNVSYIESEPTNHQIINNSFHASSLLSLNDDIVLDKTEIFKSLLLSKSLVEVNLCNRPTSTPGESTSVHFTQTDDSQRFQFDDEMDHQKFKINPSPSSGDFLEDLSHELKFSDSDQAIFEGEFLASFYGMYRRISNNIHLIGDNLGVLFCLKRGSTHNLFANEILKYLAYLWLNSPFFLNVSYIKSVVGLVLILVLGLRLVSDLVLRFEKLYYFSDLTSFQRGLSF